MYSSTPHLVSFLRMFIIPFQRDILSTYRSLSLLRSLSILFFTVKVSIKICKTLCLCLLSKPSISNSVWTDVSNLDSAQVSLKPQSNHETWNLFVTVFPLPFIVVPFTSTSGSELCVRFSFFVCLVVFCCWLLFSHVCWLKGAKEIWPRQTYKNKIGRDVAECF